MDHKREFWYCVEGAAFFCALFLLIFLGAFIQSGCVLYGQTEEEWWDDRAVGGDMDDESVSDGGAAEE